MKKKATLSFSVKFIVGIILILIFLILFLAFIRSYMHKSRIRLEEQMVVGAPKPYVEIVSPEDYEIFEVGDDVNFRSFVHSYTPKVKIVGYFWDFDGDGYIDSREEHYKRAYYEPGDYNITLKALNDLGGIGSDSVIVRIFTKNKKNLSKYEGNPVFFTPSLTSPDPLFKVDNWREILKVIPLTRWYDKNGDHKYDYIAIAKGETLNIEPNDIKEKLDLMNKKNGVVFDVGGISISDEYSIRNENTDNLENYFSYWEDYKSVVLVDENNFDGALIAALFAAYYNSPLVFIPDRGVGGSYSDYDGYLLGRNFYIIDPLFFPNSAKEYYTYSGRVTYWTPYESDELRDPSGDVNRIIKLESKLFVSD